MGTLILSLWGHLLYADALPNDDIKGFFESVASNFSRTSVNIMIGLGVVIFVVILILIFLEIVQTENVKSNQVQSSWQAFNDLIYSKKLNTKQVELLTTLINHNQLEEPDGIISSLEIFERCVDNMLNYLQNAKLPDETVNARINGIANLRRHLNFNAVPENAILYSTRELIPGKIIKVQIPRANEYTFFPSKIVENNELEMVIEDPQYGDEKQPLVTGVILSISFMHGGDNEYQFNSRIKRIDPQSQGHLFRISHSNMLQRKRLREFIRYEVSIPVQFNIIGRKNMNEEDTKNLYQKVFSGTMQDISGGGIRVLSAADIHEEDELSLSFALEHIIFRHLPGKVVRLIEEGTGGEKRTHILQIKFTKLDVPNQEKIIKFIFEKKRMETSLQ